MHRSIYPPSLYGLLIRCIGTPPFFSAMFSKGDNFCELLAYLEDKVVPKWGLLVRERICSSGSRFFPYIEFSQFTLMCLSIGTPKNNKFSICPKWKIHYFQVSQNLG